MTTKVIVEAGDQKVLVRVTTPIVNSILNATLDKGEKQEFTIADDQTIYVHQVGSPKPTDAE